MQACSEALDRDHPASLEDMSNLLKRVSAKHVTLCREAASGQVSILRIRVLLYISFTIILATQLSGILTLSHCIYEDCIYEDFLFGRLFDLLSS